VHIGYWWGNLREEGYLKDPGVEWMLILQLIFEKCNGSMDWIGLAQDRDRWWALVNTVMSFQVQ
jgi:hypothetical protein